jgi:hypothetical protein
MEMAVNARDREQHAHDGLGLGLGLSLSLSIATAAPVEPPPPQKQQQRAISIAPISSHPAPPPPQPQWWNGGAGLFFSPSPGEHCYFWRRENACMRRVSDPATPVEWGVSGSDRVFFYLFLTEIGRACMQG